MRSVNPCLSPSEVEYILKQTCDPITDNSSYLGLVGAGRLNAYKAVKFAQEVSCMNIKGIDINTICRPGKISGLANPKFTVIMEGGKPPYTYKWEPITTASIAEWNTTVLDDYSSGAPTIISSTPNAPYTNHIAHYRLIVTDQSAIQKMAIKIIKVNLSDELKPIIAIRDSYMDMLNEANDQRITNPYDIDTWTSPDIWNRQLNDGIFSQQNPEYFISAPNYVNTRIRNYGCASSTAGQNLKLYWSKGSTGEKWDADWNTTNVNDIYGHATMPGGREITPSSGISIPALAPTATTYLVYPWFPPKPQDFEGAPNSFDACILARIEKSTSYPYGMTIPEMYGKGVGQNVRNNNTIATRNMVLNNLNAFDIRRSIRDLIVGNGDDEVQTFNLSLEADRPIYPALGGDFSTLGKAIVHLGNLFDRWQASGGLGEFSSYNTQSKTVTMQGNSKLTLNNLTFAASERFNIQIEFLVDSNISIVDSTLQRMHFRQYLSSKPDSLYGAMEYELKVQPNTPNTYRITNNKIQDKNLKYKISPNPTNGIFYLSYIGADKGYKALVSIYNNNGQLIYSENVNISNLNLKEFNLKSNPSGLYFIRITDPSGDMEVIKIVKE